MQLSPAFTILYSFSKIKCFTFFCINPVVNTIHHKYTTVLVFGVGKIFLIFLCSPSLHLFDQKYSEILLQFKITLFIFLCFKMLQSWIFRIIISCKNNSVLLNIFAETYTFYFCYIINIFIVTLMHLAKKVLIKKSYWPQTFKQECTQFVHINNVINTKAHYSGER